MRHPLVIAVAQPPCAPHDITTNAITHAATIREAAARVVVFPELSLTGYELDTPVLNPDDARLAPIIEACDQTGTVALAGAPVPGRSRPHIATLAIDRGGATIAYHKTCLGDAEARRFAPGATPERYNVDGWWLGLAICKDITIPDHAARTAQLGIDIYAAGTVKHAEEAARQARTARDIATTHQIRVAIASFAGPTGGGFTRTAAHSGIWAPDGTMIAGAGTHPGAIARATLH